MKRSKDDVELAPLDAEHVWHSQQIDYMAKHILETFSTDCAKNPSPGYHSHDIFVSAGAFDAPDAGFTFHGTFATGHKYDALMFTVGSETLEKWVSRFSVHFFFLVFREVEKEVPLRFGSESMRATLSVTMNQKRRKPLSGLCLGTISLQRTPIAAQIYVPRINRDVAVVAGQLL